MKKCSAELLYHIVVLLIYRVSEKIGLLLVEKWKKEECFRDRVNGAEVKILELEL